MAEQQPKRALVLSGGGGRGAFELGVMDYLINEAKWTPDMLIGTSIGSMNAAVYAVGGLGRLTNMWDTLKTRDMQRFFRWPLFGGMLDRKPWRRTLERFAPLDKLAQVTMPLYIAATDTVTGHPIIYTNDPNPNTSKPPYKKVKTINHEHLLASSSIPFVYPRTAVDEADCWDGAVMYNSPLNPAIDAGATQIIAVLLSPYHRLHPESGLTNARRGGTLPPPPSDIVGQIGYVLDMVLVGTFENDFEQLRRVNKRVRSGQDPDHKEVECIIVAPNEWISPLAIITYDPDFSRELRRKGYEAAKLAWERIQQQHAWDSVRD